MKNKYIKYTILAVAIVSVLALTVFKHEHTFAEATCTTPKTCTECNEFEGEALGHNWLDATCENPKTCSVCNLTEGEALEHTWLEATAEAPETCSECGLTQGEPLPPTNIHVDSTGSDVTIDEGDYVEPTMEEIGAEQTTDLSDYDARMQKFNDDMKKLYEAGVLSEEEYKAAVAYDPATELSKDQTKPSQSAAEEAIAKQYEENAKKAFEEMGTNGTGQQDSRTNIQFGQGDYTGLEHIRIN